MDYRMCAAQLTPHVPHMNDDGTTRCLGVPERDDRARTFNPRARPPGNVYQVPDDGGSPLEDVSARPTIVAPGYLPD